MSDSVLFVIDTSDADKADCVPWSRRKNPKYASNRSSLISAYREAGTPIIEMVVLLLFLLVTVVAIVGCFSELSLLLESDALRHLAAKAIEGGA
jgi:hypothetical protein